MHLGNLGKVIKDLRVHSGLTQSQLAEGICTQAQISKLENGSEMPSSITLFLISGRLGVDMNYFFNITSTPRLDYVKEFIKQVRYYTGKREYEEVLTLLKAEETSPIFNNSFNKQFILWHEGICIYYLTGDYSKSIDKLETALELTKKERKVYSEREIEILNSIAIIHDEHKQYELASIVFEEALNYITFLPTLQDNKIPIRILYGYSKTLRSLGKYKESIEQCNRGILLCRRSEVLYLMGELYFQKGLNYKSLEDVDNALPNFTMATRAFSLEENKAYEDFVNKQIDALKHKDGSCVPFG